MKTAVTIAAYNEEEVIGDVIAAIPDGHDVIVIDDGSTDRTREVALSHGAQVVTHVMNLGQGTAVLTGFLKALKGDYDIIIEMDGDGQHDPADIPRFLEQFENDPAIDVVIGSRILGSSYDAPFARRTFLPYVTGVINLVTGYKMTDSMSGYRAFRAESLARCGNLLRNFLEPQYLASEMFIKFSNVGLKVSEIPIHIADRSVGISRKGLFRYGWGVIRTIIKSLLQS